MILLSSSSSSTSNRAIRLTSGLFAELRLTASTLRSSRGTDSTSGYGTVLYNSKCCVSALACTISAQAVWRVWKRQPIFVTTWKRQPGGLTHFALQLDMSKNWQTSKLSAESPFNPASSPQSAAVFENENNLKHNLQNATVILPYRSLSSCIDLLFSSSTSGSGICESGWN